MGKASKTQAKVALKVDSSVISGVGDTGKEEAVMAKAQITTTLSLLPFLPSLLSQGSIYELLQLNVFMTRPNPRGLTYNSLYPIDFELKIIRAAIDKFQSFLQFFTSVGKVTDFLQLNVHHFVHSVMDHFHCSNASDKGRLRLLIVGRSHSSQIMDKNRDHCEPFLTSPKFNHK